MSKKTERDNYWRKWLNPGGIGAVDVWTYADLATLTIFDGTDSLRLSFDAIGAEGMRREMGRVAVLQEALERVRKHLEAQGQSPEEDPKP